MKGRFFWIGIFVVSLSFIANTIYAQSNRLAEPIFLEHYIETTVDQYPTFYYITNRDDPATISYVEMNEVASYVVQNDGFFGFEDVGTDALNEQTFTHHALRSFQIRTDDLIDEDAFKDGKFEFDEMTIHFNDGTDLTTPIGLVIINEEDYNESLLDGYATTSFVEGGLIYSYRTEQDLKIEEISMTFDELFQNEVTIEINTDQVLEYNEYELFQGTDLKNIDLPISLKENQQFQLYAKITSKLIGVMDFPLYISGTATNGDEFTTHTWINNTQFYLNQDELKQIIKDKSRGVSK